MPKPPLQSPRFLAALHGYNEALTEATATESERRDFAYLGLPKTLCGVQVVLMTLRQFVRLLLLKNPLVCGGDARAEDIGQFLWLLSPHYMEVYAPGLNSDECAARRTEAERRRRCIVDSIVEIPYDEMLAAIRSYIDEIFADKPSHSHPGVPVTSFASVIIDIICEAYQWPLDAVLDCPLPVLYQAVRRIILSANPKAAIIDDKTDRIKREAVARLLQEIKDGEAAEIESGRSP